MVCLVYYKDLPFWRTLINFLFTTSRELILTNTFTIWTNIMAGPSGYSWDCPSWMHASKSEPRDTMGCFIYILDSSNSSSIPF